MAEERKRALAWAPQAGPQAAYVSCPIYELFYGGARGGGKTDGSLGDWLIHAGRYGKKARGLMIRRTYTALEDTILRSHELFPLIGAKWLDQKGTWKMPGGGTLRMRYLKRDADAMNYQGHGYTRAYIEEVTQFASPDPIKKLHGAMRSSAGVHVGFRQTGNPGGPGHTWVKARHIDPAPGGWKILTDEASGMDRIFIPSKLRDNPKLLQNDPQYVNRLHMVGSEALVAAWLDGDWDTIEGAFFDCWSSQMVLRPFDVPADWRSFVSMDWGSAKPFSIGWWAIAAEDYTTPDKQLIPRGALVRFAEWYGCKENEPNVGQKLTSKQVQEGIIEREKQMYGQDYSKRRKPMYRVADPAIFACHDGPSIAERFMPLIWTEADNTRVGKRGAVSGWDHLRVRMIGEDGVPMLFVFDTCKDSIRTIPSLQHDELNPEDLDTKAEDHAADEWRYGCASRPWQPPGPAILPPRKPTDYGGQSEMSGDWKVA